MKAIDIDVGGTFTDLVLTWDDRRIVAKSPTTPYDLSVGFLNVLNEGARLLDEGALQEILPQIEIVRYSTTVAMNRLIERKGPKLGLITTEGHEDAILIGRGAQWTDGTRIGERRNLAVQSKPEPLINRDMIVGIGERVDSTGAVIRPLDEDDVRVKLRHLVDNGARAIAVSLLWSFQNPEHERAVRRIIREEYKGFHVGYLPVVLSHEVVGKVGEYERTMTAILDAYLQTSIKFELETTWDQLRSNGYRGTFLLTHNTGGSAEIFKTTASRTFNGGPVSGLIGSFHIGKELGYRNVIASDVGGTSFDVGMVVDASVRSYEFRPIIDRWMVGISMLQTTTMGAGGGSIAWVNELLGNRLEVGPRSAGSYPGPACYDLGGIEPTVTDADVVLGYIAPDGYFGGKMPLNRDKAVEAIRTRVAEPLGVSVDEAAALVRRIVEQNMASAIKREVHLRGYHPSDFALFAFGGGGPTHVAGYKADVGTVVIFPQAPVFSALGSSVMDIMHVYEQSGRMQFMKPLTGEINIDKEQFNSAVQKMIDRALLDLEAEGLAEREVIFSVELDMLYGGQVQVKRVSSPLLRIETDDDAQAIYDAFEKEFSEAFSPYVVNKPGGVYLDGIVVKATVVTEKLTLPVLPVGDESPAAAQTATREAYWPELGSRTATPVYSFDALTAGNVVVGPAIVEMDFSTIVVPPVQRLRIDEHGLGILESDTAGVDADSRDILEEVSA
ncbi:acetophenone carboxylase [Microbacterium sp. Leaf347]|uniref:hydantoinase/oxoprolinase family protein n=2 Tax=Bacteria TaxID=2 RepID=UPI0006FB2634|nr:MULTISPECIES: hydantoinase/oxoprolinase family protein [Microbacterium]KQR91152.1 acetophenone carboxylase [Microbacterium sp. Leaf347]KQS01163.1 acetophenone carboxylase [Microbacterium sp. Leaf351]KXC07192.1 acetophenone carboxylase [Microbacterium hominis]MBN9208637.1 hydantoinase/oxoprolinase family protein [Microbacterium ginsengisoli]